MAALPDRARAGRHGDPVRRARPRALRPRGDRPQPRGPGRGPGGGRRRRRPRPLRPAGHGAGRSGGLGVHGPAPGAGHPAGARTAATRRRSARRRRRRSRSSTTRSRHSSGWAGSDRPRVPSGLHQPDDPRRHRVPDEVAGRAAADGDRRRDRPVGPVATSGRRLPPPPAGTRSAHLGPAQPERPDERLRAQPLPGGPSPGRPAGGPGEREPHRARRRARLAGAAARAHRLPGRRPHDTPLRWPLPTSPACSPRGSSTS